MSHTTAIKGITIQNIDALRSAVAEMNQRGIKCSLIPDAKPRAYFQNQEGMGQADFVLKLDDCRYDVGLYKQENGTYETRTDFWNGEVAKVLGGVATKPELQEQAHMGKLFQMYGIHAAAIEARKTGKSVRRIENAETGQIKLVLTGF